VSRNSIKGLGYQKLGFRVYKLSLLSLMMMMIVIVIGA